MTTARATFPDRPLAPLAPLVPLMPLVPLVPLAPWLGARLVDGGALSLATAGAGAALLLVARLGRHRWPVGGPNNDVPRPRALVIPAFVALFVGVLGIALPSRALVFAGAFLAASVLVGGRVALAGGALLALAAIHPADVDALVGWPLRALLASGASHLMGALGGNALDAETVLVIEGRVADVESACAGTRSLSVLTLCLAVVVSLRELAGRATRARVLVLAACGAGLVFLALSIMRVALIAWLALGAGDRTLGDVVHTPLGLFALAMALAVALAVLERGSPVVSSTSTDLMARGPARPIIAVVACVLVMAGALRVRPAVRPDAGDVVAPAGELSFDGEGDSGGAPLPLTAEERALFGQLGARAQKRALPDGGSVLVVSGPRRAHHAPERCLAAAGFHVESAVTTSIVDVPVRRLVLGVPDPFRAGEPALLGTSFFVSKNRVVASALERGLREVLLGEGPWTFVSILTRASPDEALVRELVAEARASGSSR